VDAQRGGFGQQHPGRQTAVAHRRSPTSASARPSSTPVDVSTDQRSLPHSLEGWYAHIPRIRVVAPATLEDARGMLWTAVCDPDPVVVFEHGSLYKSRASWPTTRAPSTSTEPPSAAPAPT
jgi:hypothetical protein